MEEIKKGRRLILFPIPLQSHILPMLDVANILHSNGFSITIIHTQFNSPNPSTHPHFTFQSFPDGFSETEAATKDILHLFHLLNTKCIEPFRECLARVLLSDDVADEPVACLISDHLFHFTRPVAESLKLPNVVVVTSSMSHTALLRSFPLLRQKGYLPIQDSQREELVVELPPLKVKDLLWIPNGDDPEILYQLYNSLASEMAASGGVIFNSFQELEPDALCTLHQEMADLPIFPIGPFHKHFPEVSSSIRQQSQDHSCISWLDTQPPKSVIYVSFGTIAAIDEAQFVEIAWGLANSNQPFFWVVRPGLAHGSERLEPLPSGFLETLNGRGHIVEWAPQNEVLAHSAVGAFWTHNGWKSTLESICEGVPMICMPCFGDQLVSARYVTDVWKVGLQLEHGVTVTRGNIKKAITKLMVEKEGNEIRIRSLKLMEKVSHSLKKGGSSKQSLDSLVNYILSFK